MHQAREAVLRVALPEEVARELRQAAKARFALAQLFFGVLAGEELAEEAPDRGRRVDEGLVGLARGVAREGEHGDGAVLRDDGDREGAEASAFSGKSYRSTRRARQVGRPDGLARLPQHARAAQQLLDLRFAREPALGEAHIAR